MQSNRISGPKQVKHENYQYDLIIIGAGINGLLTAYFLLQAGIRPLLLEQGDIAKQSSWAGGGILSPLYPWRYLEAVTQLVSYSQQIYPSLCQLLKNETGIDPQWVKSGLLIQHVEDEQDARNWCNQYQIHHEWVTPEQYQERFRNISIGKGPSIYFEDVAQVRNPRLVKALAKYLSERNVPILSQQTVQKISLNNHAVEKIVTNNQTFSCDTVCLTNGAWMRQLIPEGYQNVSIEPVKGQMILLQSTPELINHIVLRDSHYVIPRQDGLTLVGSTLEKTGYDKTITEEAQQQLLSIAGEIVPRLHNYKLVNHWAGLRPGSPNGIPNICQHPEIQGLFVNGGQYRNGVAMGPASGQLMANLILQEPPIVDAKSYQLAAVGKLSPVQKSY